MLVQDDVICRPAVLACRPQSISSTMWAGWQCTLDYSIRTKFKDKMSRWCAEERMSHLVLGKYAPVYTACLTERKMCVSFQQAATRNFEQKKFDALAKKADSDLMTNKIQSWCISEYRSAASIKGR
jgi:hypothetical protein